ncbi:MAG: hypothetical protein M1835_006596 [Candelina submexicana]|nr:MAG: hypothetical protein M1835_006596 [Candelina submexicana]
MSLKFPLVLAVAVACFGCESVEATRIWVVNIDRAPAPPPEKGPPISRTASRDRRLLPGQIGGIFGAYVLAVVIIGAALLIVGRRLRRSAQTSSSTLDVEMVKPVVSKAFDPSPISPDAKRKMWPSPKVSMKDFTWPSPKKERAPSTQGSIVTFDEQVIEDDKAHRQREMERLYAAVMEQDATQPPVTFDPTKQPTAEKQSSDHSSPTKPQPPRMKNLSPRPSALKLGRPGSPLSNQPRSPLGNQPKSPLSKHSRASSITSFASKRRGIRGIQISSPVASPKYSQYGEGSDEEPLTPRFYEPGPAPSPPERSPSLEEEDLDDDVEKPMPRISPRRKQSAPSTTTLPLRSPTGTGSKPIPRVTKTTILERPAERDLGMRTGVPMTPYSPYMPFTPITPVTPRLISRQERKQKQKEEGKRVAFAEDKVKEDGELWASGY